LHVRNGYKQQNNEITSLELLRYIYYKPCLTSASNYALTNVDKETIKMDEV